MTESVKGFDKAYLTKGLEVPWNLEEIPSFFRETTAQIKPCSSLDLGCGIGQYANYLARKGFEVTGIDFSEKAINLGKERFTDVNFIHGNVLDLNRLTQNSFDFIYDISLIHHIHPNKRAGYLSEVHRRLSPGGTFLVCGFSTEDIFFEGKKEKFSTDTDSIIYPLDLAEIAKVFSNLFKIDQIRMIKFGKDYQKERWLILMRKRDL